MKSDALVSKMRLHRWESFGTSGTSPYLGKCRVIGGSHWDQSLSQGLDLLTPISVTSRNMFLTFVIQCGSVHTKGLKITKVATPSVTFFTSRLLRPGFPQAFLGVKIGLLLISKSFRQNSNHRFGGGHIDLINGRQGIVALATQAVAGKKQLLNLNTREPLSLLLLQQCSGTIYAGNKCLKPVIHLSRHGKVLHATGTGGSRRFTQRSFRRLS